MFPRLIALAFIAAGCAQAADLQVRDAQVRDLLPGSDTTAGYFTLQNNTPEAVTLVGAHSPQARAIEMHETVVQDDRVSMQRVEHYVLGPGEAVRFSPGGLHLMIFGVAGAVEPFPIILHFEGGEQVEASFSKLSN